MKAGADIIAENIDRLTKDFATNLVSLAGEDPNLRNGVLKSAIRDVAWTLLREFPDDQSDIAEMFEIMAELVRSKEDD